MKRLTLVLAFFPVLLASDASVAQDDADLAKQSQNPVSDLVSLPFQNNTSFGIGENDRTNNILNIQPVYPFKAGNINIINRTIAPVIYQPEISETSGGTFGLGDINHTTFFSPARPGKIIWGAGPIVSFPSATATEIGNGKLGLGPSAVVLTMPGRWVIGTLVNNVWSVAGDSDRAEVNAFLLQYFVNYNFPGGWYFTSAPIITANWKADSGNRWLVPFGAGFGKIGRLGRRPINSSVQVFYNAVRPDDAASPGLVAPVPAPATVPEIENWRAIAALLGT